jgi:aminoglycoside phosphotransferase (APT) family kinase protein
MSNWEWDQVTLSALNSFLDAQGLAGGPPEPRRIGDGHSNLTYLIKVREGHAVLRRPPPPPIPKGANDVLREARVMAALQDQDVPVPKIYAVAQAGAVLDVPFYIMEHVPGPIITDTLPDIFKSEQDGETMVFSLIRGLASLHAVDWRACGLEGFGRPENFNARHLKRLEGLMQHGGAPTPALVEMAEYLRAHIPPESGASIIHNDYRLGNVIWAPEAPPRLMAILDWELATIGDPLLDLGYMAACYPIPDTGLTPTQELSAAFLAPGFPSLQELFAEYARLSGRDLSNLAWYAAMASWKLAVLYDYQHKQARDSYYEDATQAPRFLSAAERFLDTL